MTASLKTVWEYLGGALGWVLVMGVLYYQGCVERVDTIYRISSGPRTGECVYATKNFFGLLVGGGHPLPDEVCWEYGVHEAGDEYRPLLPVLPRRWESTSGPSF